MAQFTTKLRKDDEVTVLTGRHKGQTGKIQNFDRKNNKVFVTGVNLWKRHLRPNVDAAHPEGGIVEKIKPLPISNIALLDPKTKKPTKIGFKLQDGKKVRYAKDSGSIL